MLAKYSTDEEMMLSLLPSSLIRFIKEEIESDKRIIEFYERDKEKTLVTFYKGRKQALECILNKIQKSI